MDKRDELIAEQQLKIRELERINAVYKKHVDEINSSIFCCGGPLNDNYYGYNKDQLKIFWRISNLSKSIDSQDIDD
jgi:hypothetical protein